MAEMQSQAAHKYIGGWKAQTEFLGEYKHNGSTWALNFFAIDEEDAKRKIESIRSSAALLGRLEETIPVDDREVAAISALEGVLAVVCKYLPPDGIDAKEALSRIIAIVDPWPLGGNKSGS